MENTNTEKQTFDLQGQGLLRKNEDNLKNKVDHKDEDNLQNEDEPVVDILEKEDISKN